MWLGEMIDRIENLIAEGYKIEHPFLCPSSNGNHWSGPYESNFTYLDCPIHRKFKDMSYDFPFNLAINELISSGCMSKANDFDYHEGVKIFYNNDITYNVWNMYNLGSNNEFRIKFEKSTKMPKFFCPSNKYLYLSGDIADMFFDLVDEKFYFYKEINQLNSGAESKIYFIQPRVCVFVEPRNYYYVVHPKISEKNLFIIYDTDSMQSKIKKSWSFDDSNVKKEIESYEIDISYAYKKTKLLKSSCQKIPIFADIFLKNHLYSLSSMQWSNSMRNFLGNIPIWSLNGAGNYFFSRDLVESLKAVGFSYIKESTDPSDDKGIFYHV